MAAQRLYPGSRICPQLKWDKEAGRHFCGLMQLPGDLGMYYRKELYAGAGCSSTIGNTWRVDIRERAVSDLGSYSNPLPLEFQIFLKCYATEFVGSDQISLILAKFKSELLERDYSQGNADLLVHEIAHCIEQNRRGMFKDFMG